MLWPKKWSFCVNIRSHPLFTLSFIHSYSPMERPKKRSRRSTKTLTSRWSSPPTSDSLCISYLYARERARERESKTKVKFECRIPSLHSGYPVHIQYPMSHERYRTRERYQISLPSNVLSIPLSDINITSPTRPQSDVIAPVSNIESPYP